MVSGVEDVEQLARPDATRRTKERRICMVLHSLYPHDTRVRRQAMAAAAAGHTVDIICLREPGQARSEKVGRIRTHRLAVRHVPGAGPGRILFEYLTFAALSTAMLIPAAVRRRYDVVHVHNPPDFLIIAAVLPR